MTTESHMVELPAIGSLPLFLAVVRSSDHSMSLWCPCRNAPAVGIHKPVARRKGTSAANVCSPPIRQRQIANDATMVFYPTFSSFPGDSLLQLFGFFPHQVKLQPAPRALAVLHDQTRRFLELDRLDLGPGGQPRQLGQQCEGPGLPWPEAFGPAPFLAQIPSVEKLWLLHHH